MVSLNSYAMVDQAGAESARMMKVLDHPVRQRIIELLGTRGPMQWKQLSTELGIGTGALYYHVDTLEGIVSRDPDKRYMLTKSGRAVFEYLQRNPLANPAKPILPPLASVGTGRRVLAALFMPRPILYRLTSNPARATVTFVVLSTLFVAATLYLGYSLRLFFFVPGSTPVLGAATFSATLAVLVGMGYWTTRAFFGGRPNILPLAASAAFSLLPVLILSLGLSALNSWTGFSLSRSAFTVLLVFSQGWSASLLGAGISVASGVRIEKTVLVSLTVLYATLVIMFLQGSVF